MLLMTVRRSKGIIPYLINMMIIIRQVSQKLSRPGNHLACPSKIRVHNSTCAHAMSNGS